MPLSPTVVKLRKSVANKKVTIKDDEGGDLEFTIRPLSTFELAENADTFQNVPKGMDLDHPEKLGSGDQLKLASTVLIPMIKTFVPLCAVDPIITNDEKDPRLQQEVNILHMRNLPINVAGQLFNEILSVSGLGKKADEDRKNLPVTTLSTSQ